MSKAMPVIARGYLHNKVTFESRVDVTEENLSDLVLSMAQEHAQECADGRLGMIEFEFPWMPPEERFFRMGVDPTGMVLPLELPWN